MPEGFDKNLFDFAEEENQSVDFEALRLRILEAHAQEERAKKARLAPATLRRWGFTAACLLLCVAAGSIAGRSLGSKAEKAAPAAEAPAAPAADTAAAPMEAAMEDAAAAAPAAAAPQPAPAPYGYTEAAAEEAAPAAQAQPGAGVMGRAGEANASGAAGNAPTETGVTATAAYDPYVQLINRTHTLDAAYVPAGLAEIDDFDLPNIELKKEGMLGDGAALEALRSMLAAAQAEGVTGFYLVSAYRSYEEQAGLWARKLEEDPAYGADGAPVESMPPGASEHQSGLAFDITSTAHPSMSAGFADTAQGRWLAENAHRFGFILRYPAGKEALTGVVFEPWHFRYVGEWNAPSLYESGLVMEEAYGG